MKKLLISVAAAAAMLATYANASTLDWTLL